MFSIWFGGNDGVGFRRGVDGDRSRAVVVVSLIGTGSEVGLAVTAKAELDAAGIRTRVVSMPSTDVFERQDAAYRESVLPNAVRNRVAVEAGVTGFWRQYVGLDGAVIGIDTFGASAPADALYKHFGITTEHVVAASSSALAATARPTSDPVPIRITSGTPPSASAST